MKTIEKEINAYIAAVRKKPRLQQKNKKANCNGPQKFRF